jgi:hypothetical protein
MKKEFELGMTDRGFYYFDFGFGSHGKVNYRIWVNRKLVRNYVNVNGEKVAFIEFPLSYVTIKKTKKGNYVLVPDEINNVFYLEQECGYRGGASIDVETESTIELDGVVYHSPLGATGVDALKLVATPEKNVTYKWTRTGRTYGQPKSGKVTVTLDGKEIEELPDEELEELL